jgi:Fic family protein
LFSELVDDRETFQKIVSAGLDTSIKGKYLHWDELRHRTPPEGLTHRQWWLGVKLARTGNVRYVPLRDESGHPFSLLLPDPMPKYLHEIDLLGGGTVVGNREPVINAETRDYYLRRSLIEEAITSSQLEGAATTREVAKEMIRKGREPTGRGERMILNNYRTMQRIVDVKSEPLTKDLVFELHRTVTEDTLDDPTAAGRLRRRDEYRVVASPFGEVYHEPPPDDQLDERLASMCEFANARAPEGFLHPAIRAMILHFWLAYDHPFVDGNGRTARALFYWAMLRYGYWIFGYISISNIILKGPHRYGRAFLLTETDGNDLTYFLLYHAEVVRRAVEELHSFLDRRTRRLAALGSELRGMTGLNHRQRALVAHALRHPGYRYTVESHQASHGVVYQTARTDLLGLADQGLLTKQKVGRAWNFTPAEDIEASLRRGG